MSNKVLLIGRAGVGKTTIKNIIFEGASSKELILNPLEPTRGINAYQYKWLDLSLCIFDTSGQELSFLLEDEEEQIKAFENCNAIIYIFDYPNWVENSQKILEEIQEIEKIKNRIEKSSSLILFLHKMDLLNQKAKGNFNSVYKQFNNLASNLTGYPIFFTSISPNLLFSLYNAFSETLSSFSPLASKLKYALDISISKIPKTICFITNQDNKALVQTMSDDFDSNLIFLIHKTLSEIKHSNEELLEIYNKSHFIDIGSSILSIVISNLESLDPNLKNLFILSETTEEGKIESLISNIRNEIKKVLSRREK